MEPEDQKGDKTDHHRRDHPMAGLAGREQLSRLRRGLEHHPRHGQGESEERERDEHDEAGGGNRVPGADAPGDDLELAPEQAEWRHRAQSQDGCHEEGSAPWKSREPGAD
jgi:hypothetical protein